MRRSRVIAVSSTAALVVAASSAAPAAAPPVQVIDRNGVNVGALGDIVVWEGTRGGRPALIRRIDGRASAIPGVRRGGVLDYRFDPGRFRGLDLGLDRRGRVVASYRFCNPSCGDPRVVDVRTGGERRLRFARPRHCPGLGAVARWRTRTVVSLFCPERSSGLYLAHGGRARLVRAMASSNPVVDLGPDVLAWATSAGVWVASPGAPGCSTPVVRLPDRAIQVDVHVTPGRVWWGFSTARNVGGGEFTYGTAEVGPACSVSEPRTVTTFPELGWANRTFAVDGPNVYVAGRDSGGLVSAPLEAG